MSKLEVMDFFCGAGGFSEGFRQEGFKIVRGIDSWLPAVQTHNLNFGLDDSPGNILDYETSIEAINNLPDVDVIIGSPPCVSFSSSNKSGKADKSLGLKLIKSYLRVVTVKRYSPNSRLKAWLMENVPNSRHYLQDKYTFEELGLEEWASSLPSPKRPQDTAIKVRQNGAVLIAADFGAPQKRRRFVCGEVFTTGNFPNPKPTHQGSHITLGSVLEKMPSPKSDEMPNDIYHDPNYPELSISQLDLADHFYDSGVYSSQWKHAQFMKQNHPFMGAMSFPENLKAPCRTVMATRSATTRESLILKSEYTRTGDGEYRLPTIREVSTFMSFPYTYRFTGGEATKWKQIGNAVCPKLSSALARQILEDLGISINDEKHKSFTLPSIEVDFENLNTFTEAEFDSPRQKVAGSKFRRHTFKKGNMTVALLNHDPEFGVGKWGVYMFFGTGSYSVQKVTDGIYESIRGTVSNYYPDFEAIVNERIIPLSASPEELQIRYEKQLNDKKMPDPGELVEKVGLLIEECENVHRLIEVKSGIAGNKKSVPLSQLMSVVALQMLLARTTLTPVLN